MLTFLVTRQLQWALSQLTSLFAIRFETKDVFQQRETASVTQW